MPVFPVLAADAWIAGLAACSWFVAGLWHRPLSRWGSWVVAGGGLLLAAGHIAQRGGSPVGVQAVLVIMAMALGVIGSVISLRNLLPGQLLASGFALAGLFAFSLVTCLVCLVDPQTRLSAASVIRIGLPTVVLTVIVLLFRLSLGSRGGRVHERARSLVLRSALAITPIGLGALLGVFTLDGSSWPQLPADLLAGVGYAGLAFVPWLPGRVLDVPVLSMPRWVPYLLAFAAATVVTAQALRTSVGFVPILLSGVVVTHLVALQALALAENQQLVRDLAASHQRLAATVENAADLIVRLDPTGTVEEANGASRRLLGRAPRTLIGHPLTALAAEEAQAGLLEIVRAVATGRRPYDQLEFALGGGHGGSASLRLRAVPGGAVGNLHDVTDAVQLRRRLEQLARYDQMTGLANRSHLLETVDDWLAAGRRVDVLYGDLDGFKAVNDRFAHAAGDEVLQEVAHRLGQVAASSGLGHLAARLGGDEFAVAVSNGAPEQVMALACALSAAMREPLSVQGRPVVLALSLGLSAADAARLPGDRLTAAVLMHRADLAMYEAKRRSPGQVERWRPELEVRARRRVDIAIGLRPALDSGRLAIFYQPIVRLSDLQPLGAEALIRVPARDGGPARGGDLPELVSPAELVEVAEDTGTIVELGRWVLQEAARQAASWAAAGHPALVSVNMSVQQLASPGFAQTVRDALAEAGLPAERLVLEITESRLVGERGPAFDALHQLRRIGVLIAIDDFGTGYSSLSYLRRLPVRVIKLDRSLLQGVGQDERATALVRAVTGMAAALDLLVIAEGLEDADTLAVVRNLGCYAGQGFVLSPAAPAAAMLAMLRAGPLSGSSAGPALQRPTPVPATPAEGKAPAAGGTAPAGGATGGAVGVTPDGQVVPDDETLPG